MNNNFDFRTLKYNLYELLNVNNTDTPSDIKKQYLKIIKNFHPDKNNSLEEEIYYHIIISGKILTNQETKEKYDNFLINQTKLPSELKDNFSNEKEIFDTPKISNDEFINKMKEIDRKHNYDPNHFNYDIDTKLKEIKNNRNNISIPKEDDIKDTKDFINKFESKKKTGVFDNQIIKYDGEPQELSSFVIGDTFTNLDNINKLYVEDNNVFTNSFTSLDQAFTLQPIINIDIDTRSPEKILSDKKNLFFQK